MYTSLSGFTLVLILFTSILLKCNASNVEYDGWLNINLQHSLNELANPVFTERGNISIQSLRLGTSTIKQQRLNPEDRSKLHALAKANEWYQLKAIVTANDGSTSSFISTVKACMLAESGMNDILSISLDYAGRVMTVTMAVASTSACEGADVPLEKLKEFTTSVFVRHTETGPSPDTASYIQKLEREREAKERGEVKDNRSFFAKYWMYILPVVLIMVLSSATNPEAQGGGNGGGAAR